MEPSARQKTVYTRKRVCGWALLQTKFSNGMGDFRVRQISFFTLTCDVENVTRSIQHESGDPTDRNPCSKSHWREIAQQDQRLNITTLNILTYFWYDLVQFDRPASWVSFKLRFCIYESKKDVKWVLAAGPSVDPMRRCGFEANPTKFANLFLFSFSIAMNWRQKSRNGYSHEIKVRREQREHEMRQIYSVWYVALKLTS